MSSVTQLRRAISAMESNLLENRIKGGTGLLNPLSYYLSKVCFFASTFWRKVILFYKKQRLEYKL